MDYGIRSGQMVYTMDGDKLGEIKEVRGDYFKVDVSMQPDYWLSTECIRGGTVGGDRVDLAFDKSKLGDYKVDKPAM
ncbi:MAG: hypothetical protein WD557_16520 [Dehalococcoidia bacterium]